MLYCTADDAAADDMEFAVLTESKVLNWENPCVGVSNKCKPSPDVQFYCLIICIKR